MVYRKPRMIVPVKIPHPIGTQVYVVSLDSNGAALGCRVEHDVISFVSTTQGPEYLLHNNMRRGLVPHYLCFIDPKQAFEFCALECEREIEALHERIEQLKTGAERWRTMTPKSI